MQRTNIDSLRAQLEADGDTAVEAIREDSFSCKVMQFEPGDEDPMDAHAEEEVYLVDTGKATLATEEESVEVEAGDVVHLEAGTDHRFTDFEDSFLVVAMYVPAEGDH